jgi:hypothetical protein
MNMYPAEGHSEGASGIPWFTVQGDYLVPAHGHPDGSSGRPWYSLR